MNKPSTLSMSRPVTTGHALSPTGQDRTGQDRRTYSYPANRPALRGDQSKLAARIAANQLDRLDELSLIGYPGLDPATREVYEVALRLAARSVLEHATNREEA